ncbi:unnamed protein product [Phytophthora lilii]|uniref:Unnamed protein product n=1 Tax=Phytophthora lilii TaxID=2077276 RepID=A0A9W6U9T3_9STRA|nr:unnamed protein product [Phytophthora lilii]
MEVSIVSSMELSESEREEYAGKKANLALQRALNGAGAWMVTSVRDQRKCDHALLPAEMPASIRAKVARILQDRGGKEKIFVETPDPKAPWHQQLEQHVARLMQQMRSQPRQFRQLLLMAASEPTADCVISSSSSQGFVDSRRAYRRLRRAAMALGEEIFYLVRAFVRRSESNGVLPQDAQVVRLASLYKLELRRHVTISAVIECIHQADSGLSIPASKVHGINKPGFCGIKKAPNNRPLLRRQVKSAGVTSGGCGELDVTLSPRATSAPADTACRGSQNQQTAESGNGPSSDKIKSVHAFKLQALERLLAKTWQGSRSASMRSLQAVSVGPVKLSDETIAQIQERVTAFLYHRSRENYPLWNEPQFSREETARQLRLLVSTLMTTPLLLNLTIEQLLEVARAARWQRLAPGDALCIRNTEIEALVVVMDGSLVSSASTEPTSPSSPPPSNGVVISAPACLGELGMVRNAERWPRTLTALSEGVKVLLLPKLTFEALLHKFFSGGKATPPALAAVANLLQPRRPSSSPAVVARRLARNYLSAHRPSTAAPTAAMEANIARWHEVRDEKLRDYRAGLEAEQRAAALEALQRAMEELSPASPEEQDDAEVMLQSASALIPPKGPWSRHKFYPSYDPMLDLTGNPEDVVEATAQDMHEFIDQPQINSSSSHEAHEGAPAAGSAEFADQLREFYKALNARRSVMRARLASSAPSDQMVQLSPERKTSSAGATTNAISENNGTETTWWVEEEEADAWSIPSKNEPGTPRDGALDSISGAASPYRGRLRSASFSSQRSNLSAASSPSMEGLVLPSPLKSPLKSAVASPLLGSQQTSSKGGTLSEDSDAIWLSGKEEDAIPETSVSGGEVTPETPSKNQVEDSKAATFTKARKSALNIMLTRQSTATMARHSKLLDKETAQQVLIQKHFTESFGLGEAQGSPSGRPQSGRSQSGHHPETSIAELHASHSHAPLPLRADLQRRMDSVLNDLLVPPKAKLDLVLKYTHADHYDQFTEAVQLWERVQGAVSWRERVMKSLWDFEMLASDPRRHFRSISTHRLREEKERDILFSKLNQASDACLEAMDELLRRCGDTVCLGDRPYRNKMKNDYIELLYEVEQERLRIIYEGVRPHVAPAIDEHNDESGVNQEDNEKLSNHPLSGRTLINVRVPLAVTIPHALAPRRPNINRAGIYPKVPLAAAANYVLEGKQADVQDNQDQEAEKESGAVDSRELVVDGGKANPPNMRFCLATPRESIFVPASSLDASCDKQKSPAASPEHGQHVQQMSRVSVQVQQQRQAELAALSKQLAEKHSESISEPSAASQLIRPAEKTFAAPIKDVKKSATRTKQLEERASLRELFQQFITRSKN